MKPISRHFRRIQSAPQLWQRVIAYGYISILGLGFVALLVKLPLLGLLILAAIFWFLLCDRGWMRKLATERSNLSICEFASDIDPRKTDPRIIRATYEELGTYLTFKGLPIPIKASDDFKKDLHLHREDIGDALVAIAECSGRSLDGFEQNPFGNNLHTVRDLISFLSLQPKNVEQGS